MARQSKTIKPMTPTGRSNSARALRQVDRAANVARVSDRIARAAAGVVRPANYHWLFPAERSLVVSEHVSKGVALVNRETIARGSGSDSGTRSIGEETDNQGKTAKDWTVLHRATRMVDAARLSRKISELSPAIDALSRVERWIDSGSTGRAILDAPKYATLTLPSYMGATSRVREGLDAKRSSFAEAGLKANVRVAPSIRGVVSPPKILPREFARPSSDVRASNDSNGRAGITINSSPTVVINASGGGGVQREVMGALRAHREELFDQLKRESARRERAQF
jgi:hypothetical protein